MGPKTSSWCKEKERCVSYKAVDFIKLSIFHAVGGGAGEGDGVHKA